MKAEKHVLFDWGNTLMLDIEGESGPMFQWKQVQLVPHAKKTLELLQGNAKCHLATNAMDSNEYDIRRALERVEIDHLIQEIFCFLTIGQPKPSPAFFNAILDHLNVEHSQVLMVGDSLTNDILGAMDSGIQAIWYNPQKKPVSAGIISVTTLTDILDFV